MSIREGNDREGKEGRKEEGMIILIKGEKRRVRWELRMKERERKRE